MKTCSKCKTIKPNSYFNKNKSRYDGLNSWCRECMKVVCKKAYPKNKQSIYNHNKKRKARNQKWFQEYKTNLSCEICGYDRCPGAIDFHHRIPTDKKANIGRLVQNGNSLKMIQEEIDKCQILCSNCHRELHYEEKMGQPPSGNWQQPFNLSN